MGLVRGSGGGGNVAGPIVAGGVMPSSSFIVKPEQLSSTTTKTAVQPEQSSSPEMTMSSGPTAIQKLGVPNVKEGVNNTLSTLGGQSQNKSLLGQ